MSDGSEKSPDVAITHSHTEVVQTCDENGLGEDEQIIEVTETTPLPPVGSLTASSSVADITDNESELLELTEAKRDAHAGMVYFPAIFFQ